MVKKYLTTIEDLLALKDTDTKIYADGITGYYQFNHGILCYYYDDGSVAVFSEFGLGKGFVERYILIEEPVKEADESDIGKLCKFWDEDSKCYVISTLECLRSGKFTYKSSHCCSWQHCRHLTPAEVAEITGYKVEE